MDTRTAPPGNTPLTIDVVSDVVCPWCYIGKQHLDEALAVWQAQHPDAAAPVVAWHPFQLKPTMPPEGLPRREYMQAKFGSPDGGPGYQRVVAAAVSAGLEFNPERIITQPNTLRAHALISAAGPGLRQHAMAAALFRAYFVDGVNICDPDRLRDIGRAQGLLQAEIDGALADAFLEATAQADLQAREADIRGVPFFIVGQRLAVSGAQGAQALVSAFERALA